MYSRGLRVEKGGLSVWISGWKWVHVLCVGSMREMLSLRL